MVPAGLHKGSTSGTVDNATLVYKRGEWASPFMTLKGIPKVFFATRCSYFGTSFNGESHLQSW